MVGFGSTLRLARRPGWEPAYLDYETLKLLLSQIEVAYEEETRDWMYNYSGARLLLDDEDDNKHHHHHETRTTTRTRNGSGGGNNNNNDKKTGRRTRRDYREELFLESDSEEAFLSVDDDDDDDVDGSSGEDDDNMGPRALESQRHRKAFSLSRSSQERSRSASSDDDYKRVEPGCIPSLGSSRSYYKKIGRKASQAVGGSWNSGGSGSGHNVSGGGGGSGGHHTKRRTRNRNNIMPIEEEDAFYNVNAGSSGSQSFYLSETATTPMIRNSATTYHDETSSLLKAGVSPAPTVTLFTYSTEVGPLTPPRPEYALPSSMRHSGASRDNNSSYGARDASPDPRLMMAPLVRKEDRDRQHARRERRRHMRLKRERKVPRHLRVAHAKARAITERFLGLMRAETEKVLLFAQARLGELADTAGALRFPETYDGGEFSNNNPNNNHGGSAASTAKHHHHHHHNSKTNTHGSYELGDGGIHPSDSSTSEDESKIDSSDDEQSGASMFRSTTRSVLPAGISKNYSHGGLSDDTAGNRSNDNDAGQSRKGINNNNNRTKDFENVLRSKRQIANFEELRRSRSLFQRNEMILGEDMLFLSAVEEADAFTAVGVELMHVLRFIALNLIAVRKICRKHDRLLMNRMLGGYYQRLRNMNEAQKSYSHHPEDFETLGGLVARMSGDVFDAHPALIAQMNHYKLVGLYDKKIQKLANSRTVQVISSCLALSLSEYEVARSRANALNKIQSGGSVGSAPMVSDVETDDDSVEDPPSTASSISLTRLRFAVMSIFALREASRSKSNYFESYFGRSTLSYTGQAEAGAGLDGCSRDTLDWVVTYNPDAALILDCSLLYDGLKQNHWGRVPMAEVMISALAMGAAPANMVHEVAPAFLRAEEQVVSHVLSLVPESKKNLVLKRLARGQFAFLVERKRVVVDGMPNSAVGLSRMWLFLFTMNYYLSHTTTCSFLKAIGSKTAHSATIIGSPNVTAILVTLIHCAFAARGAHLQLTTLKCLMVFAALMGVAGNALHVVAIDRSSAELAVVARLLIGLCSADIIHREILSACLPSHIVPEAARNAIFKVAGVLSGLFFTSAYMAIPSALQKFEHSRQLQGPNWFMVLLWFVQLIRVLVELRPPQATRGSTSASIDEVAIEHSNEVSSSSSDEVGTPASVLGRQVADATSFTRLANRFRTSEGASDGESYTAESSNLDVAKDVPLQVNAGGRSSNLKTWNRIRRLCAFHVGIPISLFILFFCAYAQETFYSATPLITHRYFDWSGARAGVMLGSITLVVFPVTYVCVVVSRRYEERTVLKRALAIIAIAMLVMFNWSTMVSLVSKNILHMVDNTPPVNHPYDWRLGVFQYTTGLTMAFVGLIALEGAAYSLLSKCSPLNARSAAIHTGTLAALLTIVARLVGDAEIVMVDLSHRWINADIVNALAMPLLFGCMIMTYIVNKHFFFLM